MGANTNIYFPQGGDSLVVYGSEVRRKLNSLTADGANFGGTGANAEAILGSGSFSIPSTVAAGDVVRFSAYVAIPTTVSTDTLRVHVRVGGVSGTAIFDSTAVDVANNDLLHVVGEITFRTVGAAGTAVAVVGGYSTIAGTAGPIDTTATALSSLDTSSLTVDVIGVWSTENANVCKVQQLNGYLN